MDLSQFEANYTPYNFGNVAAPKKKKGGRGGSATSFISEAGGTGGALAGAATGAAIGSVVPVLGTAIGGLVGAGVGGFLGGTGGRLVENKVRDDEYRIGDSLEEGAISGILGAGPGQLLKLGAKGGMVAKGGANTLESALMEAGEKGATAAPLKTSIKGKFLDTGNQLLASQYGTISKPVARATNPTETIGKLADFGITKPNDAERIASAVTGANGIVNQSVLKSVAGSGKVPTGNVPAVLDAALKDIGLVDADAKSVQAIVKAQMGRLGEGTEADPSKVFQVMKALEKRAADLQGRGRNYRLTDPVRLDKAKALLTVRDELENGLYTTAGANKNLATVLTPELREQLIKLQPGSGQWQKYVDDTVMKSGSVAQLRSSMAPFVRIKQIIDEGDINSITMGGRVGNLTQGGSLTNSIAGLAANVIKNPAARAGASALRTAGGQLNTDVAAPGAKGIASRIGIGGVGEAAGSTYGAMRAGVPAFSAGMRDAESEVPQTLDDAIMASQGGFDPTGGMQSPDASLEQPASANPYTKENLMADIQRDPVNAAKYIDQYKSLEEIFGPAGGELAATAKTALAGSANGIDTLSQLEELFSSAGGGSGRAAGTLQNLSSKAGFNAPTQTYNDLAASSVSQLAKALNGGGQVSDTDAAVIVQALPKITDSPQVARAKFAALKQRLQNARQNTIQYGAGSLEDAIMNQGVQ